MIQKNPKDYIIYKQIYSKDCGVKVTRRVFYTPHGVVGASPTDLRYCLHPWFHSETLQSIITEKPLVFNSNHTITNKIYFFYPGTTEKFLKPTCSGLFSDAKKDAGKDAFDQIICKAGQSAGILK